MLIGIQAAQPGNNGWIGLGLSEAGGMHGARGQYCLRGHADLAEPLGLPLIAFVWACLWLP